MRKSVMSLFAVFTLVATLFALAPTQALAGSGALPVRVSFATTNVSTSAYTQLVASTVKGLKAVSVYNSGSSPVQIAFGAAGSEVVQLVAPASSSLAPVVYPASAGYGTRVSVISVTQTNSTGELDVNLIYN